MISKKNFTAKITRLLTHFFSIVTVFFLFTSCNFGKKKPVVIWTDRPEVVSYVEFFNVTQNKAKAIVVYKEKIATSLPPAKDEVPPDIVIGSYLKNLHTKRNFSSLNLLFGKTRIRQEKFYTSLLEYGKIGKSQCLLPVSFNLPMVIYSQKNQNLITDDYMLNLDQIRDIASSFNVRNKSGMFTKMGFAPSWNEDFLYTAAKINGADFKEKINARGYSAIFSWDEKNLADTVEYLKKWTSDKNSDSASEQDFEFKYLYTPGYKQLDSERCLFVFAKTDQFFSLLPEQIENLEFRWVSQNGSIYISDLMTAMGLYRSSSNKSAAKQFILWFMNESNQKNLLERSSRMNLDTKPFGFCNGFSAIRTVNERFYPSFYKTLLGNLPDDETIVAPNTLPARWESLKERVLVPYIADAVKTDSTEVKSIEDRLNNWYKQFE